MGTKVAEIVDSKCEAPGKRPNFAREFKRQLVEQTFEPGASVSLVARRNDKHQPAVQMASPVS
jgi:transposase